MAEILAAELGAHAQLLGELVQLLLHGEIAEGVAILAAAGGQGVEIAGGGELHGLEGLLRRGAADDDGEVIGRAGGGAQRQDLLLQEGDHPVVGQHRGGLLEQEGLVGGAAALGHEQEFVGVLALRIELDLGGQVVLGVLLLKHGEGRELRIAQVLFLIGVADAFRDGALVLPIGPDHAALLAHDDGGAGVLAHGQHPARRDIGVLEQVIGHETIIAGGLGIVEDLGELGQMARAQQMVDVDHGLLGQKADRLAADGEDFAPAEGLDAHALGGELAIGGLILAEGKQRRILIGHG